MTIDPTISRACAEQLLHKALTHRGDDLGYVDFGGKRDDVDDDEIDQSTESDRVDFMQELAGDALRGDQPGVLAHLLRTRTDDRMDDVTAALITHLGIVPAAALTLNHALRAAGSRLSIADADDEDTTRVSVADDLWTIVVDDDSATWVSDGTMLVDPIPDTIAIAAAGRRLREILTHPALDPFDLTIREVTTKASYSVIRIDDFAHGDRCTLNVADLEHMRKAAKALAA